MSERASSERSFFSIRYVYPGFTFLLGFFIFNPKLLTLVLESVDDGLFSGIITLVGITPLGLFLGQFWHMGLYIYRLIAQKQRDSISYLDKKIEFKENQCRTQKNYKLLIIRDFLYHYNFVYEKSENKTERISRYLSRRWDLINTIGSGCTSYLLSSIFCFFIRDWNWIVSRVPEIWKNSLTNYSFFYWVFTFAFYIVSLWGIYWINRDRQEFIIAIFRENDIPNEDITKAFPDAHLRSPEG